MKAFLEISNINRVTGRRKIRAVIHEIYEDNDKYNKNGISWNETYTRNNIDTVKGMPICVEFINCDNSEPFGHGLTGIKDGRPLFEDSVMVGVFEEGTIEEVEVKGRVIKALIGTGYINEQRYPLFVRWLLAEMHDDNAPEGSVEICKTDSNEAIIYDGGWKEKGRVPQVYDYTGYCILGIEPADDSAIVLELNQHNKREDNIVNEKTITELNNKIEEKINEVNELNNAIKDKEKEIADLNSKVEDKDSVIKTKDEEITELNSKIKEKDDQLKDLTKEINELKEEKKKLDNEKLVTELNDKLKSYNDEEKEVVGDKIEIFNKEPSKELLDAIVSEINNSIAQKILEKRSKQVVNENNSDIEDIYGDVYQTNSDEITVDDLY